MEQFKEQIRKYSFEIMISILIVLIFIIIYNVYTTNSFLNEFYEGLWSAPDYFCEKSQIDGMMIYIGPKMNGERKAVLIMYGGGVIVANKKFTVVFHDSIFNKINPFVRTKICGRLYLYDENENKSEDDLIEEIDDIATTSLSKIMPLEQNFELNIAEGKMTWTSDDGTGYAELFKDNVSSKYGKSE